MLNGPMQGTWGIASDAGHVQLRSGRIGLVSVDAKAPVTSGELRVETDEVRLELVLALDKLRTGNPLLQMAARSMVTSNNARSLTYSGIGDARPHWRVSGVAKAGTIEVELDLELTPITAGGQITGVTMTGSAQLGRVHLPLPGLGTVDDFGFDVNATLELNPAR